MVRVLLTVVAGVLLSGCGSGSTAVVEGDPVDEPYSGPMSLPLSFADRATPLQQSGAAGRALECDGEVFRGGGGDYLDGLVEVQPGPEQALDNWLAAEAWATQIPLSGYRVERDDGDRVLLSYDVDGRTKIAVITADGIRDYQGDDWWGVESWSMCDPSELPEPVAEDLNWGVWVDETGDPVPVSRIVSYRGPGHCDWQDLTFLFTGPEGRGPQFVRDIHGELARWLTTTYDADVALPDTATDTGLRREGRQLWIDEDPMAAYLVSIDNAGDVERWPAARRQPIRCA